MKNIEANYGIYDEAVEVGLQHANVEAYTPSNGVPLGQVFLIGDMPPNDPNKVEGYRNKYPKWAGTRFAVKTDYKTEMAKLQQKGVPVHSFYVKKYAQRAFEEISNATRGSCKELNVNDERLGAKLLKDCFLEQILLKVGEVNGGVG